MRKTLLPAIIAAISFVSAFLPVAAYATNCSNIYTVPYEQRGWCDRGHPGG